MLDLLYPGRTLVLQSPLSVDEVTRRLEREVTPQASPLWDTRKQLFEGRLANGLFDMMRLVHGRNTFRPVMKGRVSQAAAGTRVDVRLQLHPLALGVGILMALIAGTIAALAAHDIPVLGHWPFLVRILTVVAFAFLFAALGSREARIAIGLLADLLEAQVYRPRQVSERAIAQQR